MLLCNFDPLWMSLFPCNDFSVFTFTWKRRMYNQSLLILLRVVLKMKGGVGLTLNGRNLFTNLSIDPVLQLSCKNCKHDVCWGKWMVCLVQCVFLTIARSRDVSKKKKKSCFCGSTVVGNVLQNHLKTDFAINRTKNQKIFFSFS